MLTETPARANGGAGAPSVAAPHVEMRRICKSFLGNPANSDVSISVAHGEICALLGENGAGKTTLMNILFGLYAADSGEILVDGREVSFRSPADAIRAGIGMIHQHFTQVPNLTVLDNLMIGAYGNGGFLLDRAGAARKAATIMERFRMDVDLTATVSSLSVGQRQRVEILKALYRGAGILIMDEPTAVLSPAEAEVLFDTLRELASTGASVILITHKMKEIMRASDRVYVLRRGALVAERATSETNPEELAELMIGAALKRLDHPPAGVTGGVALEARDLRATGASGRPALDGLSLALRPGEILGLAGVSGNGQTELCDILFGVRVPDGGSLSLAGQSLPFGDPSRMIDSGIARIPEDRIGTGLFMDLSVEDNMVLPHHGTGDFCSPLGVMRRNSIARFADSLIGEYSVLTQGRKQAVRSLSGGNLQKVILSRELWAGSGGPPKAIVASQPTRGLDVGAIRFIHSRLYDERARGAAIMIVSDDLDELLEISDRIAVISGGRIVGEQSRDSFDRGKLGLWMSGVAE
jgi:general nucleoside transport system ATP-binding protein